MESARYRVAKFGGTSVQDATTLVKVLAIVKNSSPGLTVVLSAMAGMTDLLLGAAHAAQRGDAYDAATITFRQRHHAAVKTLLRSEDKIGDLTQKVDAATDELKAICQSLATIREHTPRVLDLVAARGERMLAQIFCAYAEEQGLPAVYLDAIELIQVEKQFGQLFPDLIKTTEQVQSRVAPLLAAGKLVIIPGFIGRGPDGELVTLGRGGSDLTATVLGHALKAEMVTLYKEVDGLLTADPRHVKEARIVPELHYREAAELAYYGAKVLHPRTIIPLLTHEIPLTVRSTFQPSQPGTRIAGDVAPGAFPVKALTAVLDQALIAIEGKGMMGVPGIAARAFGALAQAGLSVSMISQASSEASLCFVVPGSDAKTAVQSLSEVFRLEQSQGLIEGIKLRPTQAVIAVVGLGMKGTPGIAARVFSALARAEANVEAIAQGSSELNISVALGQSQVGHALLALHREFRLEKLRALPPESEGDVRFAVFGVGQIGRALLGQLNGQHAYFKDKMHLDLKCVGLVDTSGAVVREQGASITELSEIVAAKAAGARLVQGASGRRTLPEITQELSAKLWQLPIKKAIFVDTSADETAPAILAALKAGWHVVVANKKPLAISQKRFDELFQVAAEKGVHLRYEATVGAGLPILDTLQKLAEAGDEIREILGCFSGTLGFLMSELMAGTMFSEAVRRAYTLGYTEPDPREDLSGMDVARKALILARTLGQRLDMTDIAVEPLFPAALSDDRPETFLTNLKEMDALWAENIAQARKDSAELRYVVRITQGGVQVGTKAVPAESPLGRLRGTDNQVTITTRRYDSRPLVVSGPGAGAEVTAAGVLNDILAIATAADHPQFGLKAR